MSNGHSAAPRFVELDALRGIAAVLVVVYHYTTSFNRLYPEIEQVPESIGVLGRYGVELFFLISGFVILMTARAKTSLRPFAVARFVRLFPSYWAAVIATTAVILVFRQERFAREWHEVIINLSMVQRFAGVRDVDGVYWSLSVELLFYGLTGAAIATGLLFKRRGIELIVVAWLTLCLATTIATSVHGGHAGEFIRFATLSPWAHLFAFGMLSYERRSGTGQPAGLWVFVVAAGLANVWVIEGLQGVLVHACIMTVFYIVSVRETTKALRIRPLLYLGAISYPLYLIHQFIGYTFIEKMAGSLGRGLATIVTAIIVLVLSHIIWWLFDQRISKLLRSKLLPSRRTGVASGSLETAPSSSPTN